MIKNIRLKNFFSFKDTSIELADQNLLIGINGSGKSNFIRSIELLKAIVSGGLKNLVLDKWGGFDEIFFAGDTADDKVELLWELDNEVVSNYGMKFREPICYLLSIRKVGSTQNYTLAEKLYTLKDNKPDWVYFEFERGNGFASEKSDKGSTPKSIRYSDFDPQESVLNLLNDPDRFYPISTIRKAIEDIANYGYLDTSPSSKIRKPILSTSEKRLLGDGSNLAQVINTMSTADRKSYKLLKDSFFEINSQYEDFSFNHIGNNIEIMLAEKGLNRSIHVSKISDGTLKYLCLLAILHNSNRGSIICIDEPENGLHPDMIQGVAEGVKIASETSQFIIATHSSHLLDLFNLPNVLVFDKDSNNSTIGKRYSEDEFKGWYDDFVVGKMWRQGDIGGNRW